MLPCIREHDFSKITVLLLNCSWPRFLPLWKLSGDPLGTLLGPSWPLLNALGALLGALGALLGHSWAHLGALGRILGGTRDKPFAYGIRAWRALNGRAPFETNSASGARVLLCACDSAFDLRTPFRDFDHTRLHYFID